VGVLRAVRSSQIESTGGSIFLTRVEGAVRAATASGTITAWLTPEVPARPSEARLAGASQFITGQGDILVFVPKELPVTIDATIESPGEHRIEADPGMNPQVKVSAEPSGGRAARAEVTLNGGGEKVRVKTASGNIRLCYAEAGCPAWTSMPAGPAARLASSVEARFTAQQKVLEEELAQELQRVENQISAQFMQRARAQELVHGRFEKLQRRFELLMRGRLRVPPEQQRARLISSVKPNYPVLARQQQLEGRVRLEVDIDAEGKVVNVRLLTGHPLLASAADEAVRHWRYAPAVMDGKPVSVVTTVDFEFRLK
jgi:TonB family protein